MMNVNETWQQQAEWCLEHDEYLSEREEEFLSNILEEDYDDLTEKQQEWLDSIRDRIERKTGRQGVFW